MKKVLPSLKEICHMIKLMNKKQPKHEYKDAILYKLVLDFYYKMHLQRGNLRTLLNSVVPNSLQFYRGLSKTTFNNVISCLYVTSQDR